MKKIMKKLMIVAVVLAFVMTLVLPAMACEMRLDGSTSYQEENSCLEGSNYHEDTYDEGGSYLTEVYKDNQNVGIIANESGEETAYYTGGAYTEGEDGFKPDEERQEAYESLEMIPDGVVIQPVEVNINDIPEIPYGGDPTPQREWANEKIWEAGE
ncbi:MAG: hypothetical protein IJK18_04130 [Clostridia bacterium]|nr:hypothetical protein [Clostridia bacterium]